MGKEEVESVRLQLQETRDDLREQKDCTTREAVHRAELEGQLHTLQV
jgi:hypothetical protein